MELFGLVGESGALIIEPVNTEWDVIIDWQSGSERNIGNWINGSCNKESIRVLLFVARGDGMTPETAHVVLTVGEKDIWYMTSMWGWMGDCQDAVVYMLMYMYKGDLANT